MSSYDNQLKSIGIDPTVFKGHESDLLRILRTSPESGVIVNYHVRTYIDNVCRSIGYNFTTEDQFKDIQIDLNNCDYLNNESIEYAIEEYCTKEIK